MWIRAKNRGRLAAPLAASPVWSALIAALLLESSVALAADDAPPLPTLGSEPLLDASPRPREDVRSPLPAHPPAPALPSPTILEPHFAGDAAQPVRLEASAVLSLSEMFPFSDPWRAPLPSFETSIRTLELIDLRAAPTPVSDDLQPPVAGLEPSPAAGWFAQHIELSFDDGIAYKKNFTWRGMNLRLKVWGPVMKGDTGLGIRLRGLQLSGHPVEVRARATTDLQDVQIKISF
jgi:hypothetical protein